MTISFQNKLVAVMNEKIEPGMIMNALAHMCIGFGSAIGKEPLRLTNYIDGDGGSHPHISEMPFMILKANSNKIRGTRQAALKKDPIRRLHQHDDNWNLPRTGGKDETSQRRRAHLLWHCLIWKWDQVSELTRKFSLWK